MNNETEFAALVILFIVTLYKQVGPSVGAHFESVRKASEAEVLATDAAVEEQLKSSIKADQLALTLAEDYKQLFSLEDHLGAAQAEVLNQITAQKFRDETIKKLESLYAVEEAAVGAIRTRIINTVKEDVVKTFKSDKKAQDAALAHAISVLGSGPGAKFGKDVVGGVFANSLKSYRENYAKQPAGSDPILVQLEKDVAAISVAPVVEAKGGNVYA